MKMLKRLALLLCALFLVVSCVGVFANWMYYDEAQPIDSSASIILFPPDYPEEGESHNTLISAILDGNEQTGGLNDSGSMIDQAIKARDEGRGMFNGGIIQAGRNTIGSMASLFKEDMEKFGTAVEKLAFLVYFPNGYASTEYKIYTWSTENGAIPLKLDGSRVNTSDVEMGNWRTGSWFYQYYPESAPTKTVWVHPIYETTIVKENDVWKQKGSTLQGYAQACFYTENLNHNMHDSKFLSIYPPSFTTEYPL